MNIDLTLIPDWFLLTYIFMIGCFVGSFLNVVIYRLPRDMSIVTPPSACPACGKHIRFYNNIPLISWLLLRGRCSNCKAPISVRYFIIELLTGLLFVSLFLLYFRAGIRQGLCENGGWLVYLLHIVLLSAFIAASAIDFELWVIPISICWTVTIAALVFSAAGGWIIDPFIIRHYNLLPTASAGTGLIAAGGAVGLAISMTLLMSGAVKASYYLDDSKDTAQQEAEFNHRLEMGREILFLAPILLCAAGSWLAGTKIPPIRDWWVGFSQHPAAAGFLGSLYGYFVGCAVVWTARILGTLAFKKEAMGLGDVHLMGAAGAVIGWATVVIAFFIAPFAGLGWAIGQLILKKSRQIPYGPFLSLGIFAVMIFHDRIFDYFLKMFYIE